MFLPLELRDHFVHWVHVCVEFKSTLYKKKKEIMIRACWKHAKQDKSQSTILSSRRVCEDPVVQTRMHFSISFPACLPMKARGHQTKSPSLESAWKMWNPLMSNWNQHIRSLSLNCLRVVKVRQTMDQIFTGNTKWSGWGWCSAETFYSEDSSL